MQINRIVTLVLSLVLVVSVNGMDINEKRERKEALKIKDRQREYARQLKKVVQSQPDSDYGAYEEAVQETLKQPEAKRSQVSKTKPN